MVKGLSSSLAMNYFRKKTVLRRGRGWIENGNNE